MANIVQASANHEKIAEGLAEGLCTISEHIEDTDRDLKLSKSDDMLHLVADLYEHVFLFLSSVMDWIMEKRFRRLLDSFSDNFNERFENEIRRINKKAERIRIFATQSLMAETRVTRLLVEGLDRDTRLGLDGDKRHRADMHLFAERIERQLLKAEESRRVQNENMQKLGAAVGVLLETDASKWLETQRLSAFLLRSTGSWPESPLRHGSCTDGAFYSKTMFANADINLDSHFGIEDVVINSRHLEDYFCRSRVRLSPDDFGPIAGGEEAVTRLSEWSQGLHPPMLWFEGPTLEADDFENPLTSIAAKFVSMVAAHQLEVISYFCEVPRASTDHNTPEAEGAISLLYALLRQLVEKLPPRLDTAVDLSEARFKKLDGSMNNWTEAIELLGDVLSVLRGVVFCVIDGLHWLDGEGTDAPLAQLLTALRHDRLRVFFTTCGRSACLLDYLERDEIFIMGDLTMLRDAPYDFDTK